MTHVFHTLFDIFFSPINSLSQMIKSSDAKIISKDGMEILENEEKLRQVSQAIEDFKNNTDKSAQSKHIIVDL